MAQPKRAIFLPGHGEELIDSKPVELALATGRQEISSFC